MDYVCGLNSPPEPLNSPPEPLNSPPRRATARLARVVRVVRVSRMLKLYQHYLKHFGGKKPGLQVNERALFWLIGEENYPALTGGWSGLPDGQL
eukprot:5551255-Pyramimonas_sp.AAC.1